MNNNESLLLKNAHKVLSFLALEPNWDGREGVSPKWRTAIEAIQFIDLTCYMMLPPLDINVAGDGEIGFYYKDDNLFLDIGFIGMGTVSFFIKINGAEYLGDFPWDGFNIPDELVTPLNILGDYN